MGLNLWHMCQKGWLPLHYDKHVVTTERVLLITGVATNQLKALCKTHACGRRLEFAADTRTSTYSLIQTPIQLLLRV